MKTHAKIVFLVCALIAGLAISPGLKAQTFTTLHSFTALLSGVTNSDGAFPKARLILSGKNLYGTAYYGGSSGYGTVFAVNTSGAGFTNLYSFTGGSDEAYPWAELLLSGNTLYGTASAYSLGRYSRWGTVFTINNDGTHFTNLYNFTGGNDGGYPHSGLVLSGNTLYGTAAGGGSSPYGTVFAVNTDGSSFTNLHIFTYGDGAYPNASVVLASNTLYGTTYNAGSSGYGTVFAVHTDGTGFTNLHSFAYSDGAQPVSSLILSSNTLYGTTENGGSSGNGTVFAVRMDGTGFTNLHSFTATPSPFYTNSDGATPLSGLVLSGNTLYGTTDYGGSAGHGTVFAIDINRLAFANLHNFSALASGTNSDGAYPEVGLILSGDTLYGTADSGGSSGNGTIFSLSMLPELAITVSATKAVLTWPTNVAGFDYTGFTLQSTTNLLSPSVWSANLPARVVVNGQNTVTTPLSGTQQFYRLTQ